MIPIGSSGTGGVLVGAVGVTLKRLVVAEGGSGGQS